MFTNTAILPHGGSGAFPKEKCLFTQMTLTFLNSTTCKHCASHVFIAHQSQRKSFAMNLLKLSIANH